ncbi:LysR family transcriptional regulator [Variovorax saccharolyticus]|uniref:LysR family transcriptional regulator n=1 Tax=Variovorax saccharolyticus TaxID=3053516 RepID=UPI002575FBA1|nr:MULTISPECIES: LysR family transcriptional regulator [unclassified Variovorax]MDM0019109.1 LysR family transcriptional regulator [Variovorax sp. J22R187]MDM0026425.1 LysR family transcriptional regulator [Variovorax sp. J31P216]
MSITLRQMRAFVEVIASGGFTAAGRKLHLTQSATSLLVRDLEAHLGVQLVDRTTRKISVTDAGSEFLASAQRILADVEQTVSDTQDLVQKRRGHITIATTPLLAATFMPETIAQFQGVHPGISVRLADWPAEQIIRAVEGGDVDLGFGVFPNVEADLKREPMLRHSLGAMVPVAWPMARRRRNLTWADIADQPMIAMAHSSGFRALTDPLFHKAGVSIKPRFEVGHLGTAVGLADAGLGITVVPAYVGALLKSSRTRFRVLHDPVVHRHIELVTRSGRSLSPSASAFRDCLAARCKALQDA